MDILRIQEKLFDKLYGSLSIPVCLFDTRGAVTKVNQALLALMGVTGNDILTPSTLSFLKMIFKDGIWSLKTLPNSHLTTLSLPDGATIPALVNYIKLECFRGRHIS